MFPQTDSKELSSIPSVILKMENTTTNGKEQLCLVEEAYKRAKERGENNPTICVSCPCPKCSPSC